MGAPPPGAAENAVRRWPGPDLRAGVRTRVGVCTVLTRNTQLAPDAVALGRAAPLDTRWHSGGTLLTLAVRPLLPDEYDCVDLDRRTP